MDEQGIVSIVYTNHRGETSERKIVPLGLRFTRNAWHPEHTWLLDAVDLSKIPEPAHRPFAMKNVREWRPI